MNIKNKIYVSDIMMCAHCKNEQKTITFWDNLKNTYRMALCKSCLQKALKLLEENNAN